MKTNLNTFVSFCAIAICLVFPDSASLAQAGTTAELGWKFEYDDADRITKVTDPAGRDTRLQYTLDEDKRLRKLVRSQGDGSVVKLEFDERGRRRTMTDVAGTVSYSYNDLDRLSRVQRQGSPDITYTYDTMDRISSLQVGDFYRIEYTYDFLGRLASMKTPSGVIEYEYATGQGEVIRKLPNGIWTIWTYEPNGELRQIRHGRASNVTERSKNWTPIADYTYQYRPDGLIEAIGEGSSNGQFSAVSKFEYDNVGRLVSEARSDGQNHSYEYDLVGNRLKAVSAGRPPQTCTYDWAGRMTTLNGNPCAHDAAGNLASVNLGGKAMSYRYNQDGQLIEADGGKVSYRYNGEGRLIARKAAGVETTFVTDPLSPYWQPLVMESKESGRTLVVWDGANPLILIRNGKPEYLLHDHLGSVRLVVDGQCKVTQQLNYEPFGTITNPEIAKEFTPRFAGLFWDSEAILYLNMARAYMPAVGRFVQSEPVNKVPNGSQDHMSLYNYCGSDPVNFLDQDGLERTYYGEPVDIFVSGISMREEDAQLVAQRYLGPNAIGISVDYGRVRTPDILWAAADQTTGGYTTHTEEKLFSRLSQYSNIGSLEVHSHGAITTGNLSKKIDYAISRGSMHIGKVVFYGVNADEHLVRVLQKHDIPFSVRAHKYDPVRIVTTTSSKLGGYVPILGRIPYVRWVLGSAAKVGMALTLLPGIPGPYSTKYHDINFLHGVAASTNSQPSTALYRSKSTQSGGKPSIGSQGGDRSLLSPTPVGGVYLGGAVKSLEGVGLLDGVAFDSNNNLILVGKAGIDIKLPPLRIDDLVTVFRSVYINGEGPTVTIDPNPKNPKESAMIIRHSEATDGTYVGWVLYHADRLMKGYNLGTDNLTTTRINSAVAGYAEVLDAIYFGGGQRGTAKEGGNWERFWIVPAEARRFAGARSELTLFDVPLKLRTQPMKWQNGKLVDDTNRNPSTGAAAFTKWFTTNYDGIAQEQFLTPPSESGITNPVPVFTELRRIALLTAIAEKLRDQGVPMPFWMHDYEVHPVPFERTTPALEITRSNQRMTARIFGGVSLSPADPDVKVFNKASDLAILPVGQQAAARQILTRSVSLAEVVRKEMTAAEPLQVKTFTHQGTAQQAISLPGAETRALAPCKLDEADLVVPFDGGDGIRLVRSYNSFFNPGGPLGKGWTLDLPRLAEARVPVERDGQGRVKYRTDREVITPLNSVNARFSRIAPVPELNGSRLQVPDKPGEFLALADGKPDFVSIPTQKLIRKDGENWHFSKSGDLVATERNGFRTVYERNGDGSVKRIAGLQGRRLVASIQLKYDTTGRLQEATGQKETGGTVSEQDKTTMNYEYDANGKLNTVRSSEGRTGYRYEGKQLVAVTYQEPDKKDKKKSEEKTVRRFEYNPQGQLVAEVADNGDRTDYRVARDQTGSTLTIAPTGSNAKTDYVRYDAAFRPVEAKYADGTKASWTYPDGGGSKVEMIQADGTTVRFSESADQRHRTVELDKQRKFVGEYDTAGRLTSLSDNGRPLLRQEWLPDGRLRLASTETYSAHRGYDQDGLLSSVRLTPPGEQGKLPRFQETKLDPTGRPREITDHRGLQVLMDYDDLGELKTMTSRQDGKNYGFKVTRDKSGRTQNVESSWGKQRYSYGPEGFLTKLEAEKGGKSGLAEWKSGLLQKVRQFDGGEFSLAYDEKGKSAGLLSKITTPNKLALEYKYDDTSRLSQVSVGNDYRLQVAYDSKGRLSAWNYSAVGK